MDIKDYQPKVYQAFKQILAQGRLSHAYLLAGDFSTFDMAILLSKTIFCQYQSDHYACGVCRTCQMIEEGTFPDVKIIEPTGTVIKTDVIRGVIGEVSQSGFEGKSQVFIIKESEKLHLNAANSLLKMIEEPSSDSYIFLLTSDENRLLATIKSRCQLVYLPPNQVFIQEALEKAGLLPSQARLLVPLVKAFSDVERLAKPSKVLDLLKASEAFVDLWLAGSHKAYLEVSRLSRLALDKVEQEQVFLFLMGLLGQQKPTMTLAGSVDHLSKAKQMWQANVSLQNVLEYLILTDKTIGL